MPCAKKNDWSYNKANKHWVKRKKGKKGFIMRKTKPKGRK